MSYPGDLSQITNATPANPTTMNAIVDNVNAIKDYMNEYAVYDIKAYGAAGDGVADDYDELNSAHTAATANGGVIFFPQGTYKIGTNITINSNVTLCFCNGAELSIDNGVTVTINGPIEAGLYQIISWTGTGVVSFGDSRLHEVYPQWWGAVGDNSTDDADAINAAATAAGTAMSMTLVFPPATGYAVESTISVPESVSVIQRGRITYTGSSDEVCLQIGSTTANSTARYEGLWVERSVTADWTDEANIGIKLINLNRCHWVDIRQATDFTIGVQCIGTTNHWFGYNTLNLGTIRDNKVGLDLIANHSGTNGWANENLFLGGNFGVDSGLRSGLARYGIRVRSVNATTYPPENNYFMKPSFEMQLEAAGSYGMYLTDARYNEAVGYRQEATTTGYYVEGTVSQDNLFLGGYGTSQGTDVSSYPSSAYLPRGRQTIGGGVEVFDSGDIAYRACYYDADAIQVPNMQGFYYTNEYNYIQCGITSYAAAIYDHYISIPSLWGLGVWVDTRLVKAFVVRPDTLGANYNIYIRAYDANGNILDNSETYINGLYGIQPSWSGSWSAWTKADRTADYYISVHDDVKKMAVFIGVPSTGSSKLRSLVIDTAYGHQQNNLAPRSWVETVSSNGLNYSSEVPGEFKSKAGRVVFDAAPTTGGEIGWSCVNRQDTAIRAQTDAGDATLEVDATSGILATDVIGVQLSLLGDDGNTEDVTVDLTSTDGAADAEWIARKFTVATSGEVGAVVLNLGITGSPAGTMYVDIFSDDGGSPSVPNAKTGDSSESLTCASANSATKFTWGEYASRASLSAGDYWAVLKTTGYAYSDGVTEVLWNVDANGAVGANECASYDSNATPNWSTTRHANLSADAGADLNVMDGVQIHWSTVNSITDADTLEMDDNLPANYSAGIDNEVYSNRWVDFGHTHLEGSDTWDPGSIADGDEEAKEVTVTGAALGDFAVASFSLDVTDLVLNAQVTAADTVTCILGNNTGGAVDLGSGTLKVRVLK